MIKRFPTLYGRATTGAVQEWTIIVGGDQFWTEAGQKNGAITASLPTRCSGKNIGKANETDGAAQALLEAEAKWDKKLKSNYFERLEDIDSGFLEPQLAKPCKDYIDDVRWEDGQIVDDKLNGFACIITARGAFTRTNEQYHSIPHILEEFAPFLRRNPQAYIQGELFNPLYVKELNKIAELIAVTRKPKDIDEALLGESKRIVEFHWYDSYGFGNITAQTRLKDRRSALNAVINEHHNKGLFPSIKDVRYNVCYSFDQMKKLADEYIAKGGEGKIIKNPSAPYQHKRTKDLLKWKKQEDAEFRVIEIEEGKGNYAGCAKKVWCELPNGKRDKKFKSNIEGAQPHLRKMFQERDKYVGEWVTVRFQEYSPYGVPLIPYTDMVVREKVEGRVF